MLRERCSISSCDETHWHGCVQGSTGDAAILLLRAELQLEVAKRMSQLHKGSFQTIVLLACYAGLQLEHVTAARREELGCRSYGEGSWEAFQSRTSPDKRLPQRKRRGRTVTK